MAVRDDFAAGEVLAAADLNDTFASKVDYATPTNAQTGTAYTFVADDAERITTASNGSAVTFTIPPQSSVTWSDDTILRVVNYGAGAVTVAGGTGVTVTNTASTIGQYAAGAAIRTGSDAWTVVPFGEPGFSATGGNEVVEVGGFKYHVFTSSSTFVVAFGDKACDILVVGGGGGGGKGTGGGGGGGEIDLFSAQILTAGSYTVTVGAQGNGATVNTNRGANGGQSQFVGVSTISALGGGGGGSSGSVGVLTGASGGSGGGASENTAGPYSGGSASGSNTFAGGNSGGNVTNRPAGGGGGATAVGTNGASTLGGAGGAGYSLTTIDSNLTSANFTSLTSMTHLSAGGGGGTFEGGTGGAGGSSGQGGAGTTSSATAGGNAVSFGSGGGGGGQTGGASADGGNGKAGVVIVRYAV